MSGERQKSEPFSFLLCPSLAGQRQLLSPLRPRIPLRCLGKPLSLPSSAFSLGLCPRNTPEGFGCALGDCGGNIRGDRSGHEGRRAKRQVLIVGRWSLCLFQKFFSHSFLRRDERVSESVFGIVAGLSAGAYSCRTGGRPAAGFDAEGMGSSGELCSPN